MNLASINLNLLLAFEALFEERSVIAAARRIGLGQPGMSTALSRLRGLMQDELFVRALGEMRPTAKAFEVAPSIIAALAQLRRTLPYVMVLPAALERGDLVAALPSRLADYVLAGGRVQRFELPLETNPWMVSMLWPASARNDRATAWLRGSIAACLAVAGMPGAA